MLNPWCIIKITSSKFAIINNLYQKTKKKLRKKGKKCGKRDFNKIELVN